MVFDIDDRFSQMMATAARHRAADLRHARFHLLTRLRLVGVREISGTYDGYGDSGNFEDICLDGGKIIPSDDLCQAIGNFVWDVAYYHHNGFENNEGGFGEMTWDIDADAISLDHHARFIETAHSFHDGI